MGALELNESILPEIKSSFGSFGNITALQELEGIPITGVLGDQQAASFGLGCFKKGNIKSTFGTGTFLLMNNGEVANQVPEGLLSTVLWKNQNEKTVYGVEGACESGASNLLWLKNNLKMFDNFKEMDEKLQKSQITNRDLIFVPSFSGMFAPYWESRTKGVLKGVTFETEPVDIYRAMLEGIAFRTSDCYDLLRKHYGNKTNFTMVCDGGVSENEYLMQFIANMMKLPISVSSYQDCTPLGVALGSGLGVGFYKDLAELEKLIPKSRFVDKNEDLEYLYQKYTVAREVALNDEK